MLRFLYLGKASACLNNANHEKKDQKGQPDAGQSMMDRYDDAPDTSIPKFLWCLCQQYPLYEEWMDYKTLHVSSPTIERVRRDWNRYYKDSAIVKKPLTALTKLNVDIWVHQTIRKFNMSKHQYANFRLIIRQELDYAVDKGIIDSKANVHNMDALPGGKINIIFRPGLLL